MRVRINKITVGSLLAGVLIISVALAQEEFAYTTAYFYVPSDVSFTVYLLGTPTGVDSTETFPGASTTWISFNATDGIDDFWVQPMTEGQESYQQTGATNPIVRIRNAGNTNFNFYMNATAPACIQLCANSTCAPGDCTPQPSCQDIKDQSSWVLIASDVVPNGFVNITMYANFTTCGPIYQQGTIWYRSAV